MEALKIDRTNLVTVKNYSKRIGKSVQAIYRMMKEDRVKYTKIDGVTFIIAS